MFDTFDYWMCCGLLVVRDPSNGQVIYWDSIEIACGARKWYGTGFGCASRWQFMMFRSRYDWCVALPGAFRWKSYFRWSRWWWLGGDWIVAIRSRQAIQVVGRNGDYAEMAGVPGGDPSEANPSVRIPSLSYYLLPQKLRDDDQMRKPPSAIPTVNRFDNHRKQCH